MLKIFNRIFLSILITILCSCGADEEINEYKIFGIPIFNKVQFINNNGKVLISTTDQAKIKDLSLHIYNGSPKMNSHEVEMSSPMIGYLVFSKSNKEVARVKLFERGDVIIGDHLINTEIFIEENIIEINE